MAATYIDKQGENQPHIGRNRAQPPLTTQNRLPSQRSDFRINTFSTSIDRALQSHHETALLIF